MFGLFGKKQNTECPIDPEMRLWMENDYYYQNLGVSKALLWTTTLIFDLAIFLFLIFQIYKF